MKKYFGILCLLLICLLTSCTFVVTSPINSIEIMKNSVAIDELDVVVGEDNAISAVLNDGYNASIVWASSNPEIVSVDKYGNLTVNKKGEVVITASVANYPYITDSIYVSAGAKVEQLGVGTGATPSDPIFIGNEGEDDPIEVYFIEMQHIYADSIFIKKGNVEILIDSGYEYDGQFVNKVLTQYCTSKRLSVQY